MVIDVYTQYFTVTGKDIGKTLEYLKDFNRDLNTTKMVVRKPRYSVPVVTTEIDKVFYIVDYEDKELNKGGLIRYPISLLERLENYMKDIEYDIIRHKPNKSKSISLKFNPKKKPRDYQIVYIDTIVNTELDRMLVNLQTGMGKALAVSTPIKVKSKSGKDGWKAIGDVTVGEYVIGRDGTETLVKGVYPQGKLQLYNITFEDDREVEVSLDHLWTVYSDSFISIDNPSGSRVITTDKLLRYLENTIDYYYIDLPEPSDFNPIEYEIDPYTLGTLLATECKLNSNLVSKIYTSIPEEYLEGSLNQRLELLRGLIDINGIINELGSITYTTNNSNIANDIQLLVRSLGGLCSIDKDTLPYKLDIVMKNPSEITTIPEYKDKLNYTNPNLKLRIVSIEKTRVDTAVCIAVDNEDKLFVVKDYIVTHNTLISINALTRLKKKFMVLILPRYIGKWIDDITSDTDIKREEILVIQGLNPLLTILENPSLVDEYKCFIVSLTTISIFLTHYYNNDISKTHGFKPETISKALAIDTILNDEAHQNFYGVYRYLLHSNHRLTLGLTATLFHNDEKINNMYQIGYPDKTRIDNIVPYKKYITAYFVRYRFHNKKQISFKNNFGYDKFRFEKSILRNNRVKYNYFDMIYKLLDSMYLKRKRKGDKCIIFMASVKMCGEYVKYVKGKVKYIKVTKYTEEEDYSTIDKHDLIVSTPNSAGTALDIHNLITVLMTVNTDSIQDNIQVLGRLRKLNDMEVWYANTWSSDIKPHTKYHYSMRKAFTGKVKDMRSIEYRHLL